MIPKKGQVTSNVGNYLQTAQHSLADKFCDESPKTRIVMEETFGCIINHIALIPFYNKTSPITSITPNKIAEDFAKCHK
jgi:hypothetical protein